MVARRSSRCLNSRLISIVFDESDEKLIACSGVRYVSNGAPTDSALSRLSGTCDEYLECLPLPDLYKPQNTHTLSDKQFCHAARYVHASIRFTSLISRILRSLERWFKVSQIRISQNFFDTRCVLNPHQLDDLVSQIRVACFRMLDRDPVGRMHVRSSKSRRGDGGRDEFHPAKFTPIGVAR